MKIIDNESFYITYFISNCQKQGIYTRFNLCNTSHLLGIFLQVHYKRLVNITIFGYNTLPNRMQSITVRKDFVDLKIKI